jgi:phage baseplate assembly protein W
MKRFKGYNSVDKEFGNFKLYDADLAKRGLLNEFYTRKGERVMSPTYGSIVWDLLFDPLSDEMVELIRDDCLRLVAKDPRLELIKADVTENFDRNSIVVSLLLTYVPTATVTELTAEFNRETANERLDN